MKRQYDLYLKDILEAIERIQEYVGSRDFEEFLKENLLVDAVLRNLEIIGEAATRLPPDVKDKCPEVPWREIQDFRIIVAHHYWKINQARVWDIIDHKLGELKKQVGFILQRR